MQTRNTIGITLAVLLAGGAGAFAAVSQQVVRGKLKPTDDTSEAEGRFRLELKDRRTTRKSEKLLAWGAGLDATADEEGNRPVYDLWLVDEDENEADFGDVRLRRSGAFKLGARFPRTDFPEDVDSLDDFAGGTIELRDEDGNVVLDGDIPDFIDIDDENEPGSHAAARAKDRSRLRPPSADEGEDESEAKGAMLAAYVNRPRNVREYYVAKVQGLDPDSGPYDVIALDGSDEIDLGELETAGRRERGKLKVDTKADDEIPGDGLLELSQLDVEVRDAEGNVVLRGTFPRIQ
jgi:hypothetical protein